MSDLPLGSFFEDGVRVGPLPQYSFGNAQAPAPAPSAYSNFGPGVLLSPVFTYNISPLGAINNFDVAGTFNNIQEGEVDVPLNGAIPNSPAVAFTSVNGSKAIQLDVPRTVIVYITDDAGGDNPSVITTDCFMTIFGNDVYGNPMQESKDISTVNEKVFYKAFYVINRVTLTAPTDGQFISLSIINEFGLPYRCFSEADIITVGKSRYDSGSGITSVSEMGVVVIGDDTYPIHPLGTFEAGFTPTTSAPYATFNGVDVRGTYAPVDDAVNFPFDGDTTLLFTYYVRGADTGLNQQYAVRQANANLPSVVTYSPIPTSTTVPAPTMPLNNNDLYGFPQYYTGTPEPTP